MDAKQVMSAENFARALAMKRTEKAAELRQDRKRAAELEAWLKAIETKGAK